MWCKFANTKFNSTNFSSTVLKTSKLSFSGMSTLYKVKSYYIQYKQTKIVNVFFNIVNKYVRKNKLSNSLEI